MRRLGEAGVLVLPEWLRGKPAAPPASTRETDEDQRARLAVANDRRRQRYVRRVPRRYVDATFDDLNAEHQDQQGKVSGWLDSGHQTLLLASVDPGLGKTHMAYAVGSAALEAGLWVEAWTVIEMMSAMRREMRDDSVAPRILDDALACDLLLLDDLGKESGSAWTAEQVHHVMDVRLREERRMVITTNLTADDVSARYSHPLLDRLLDDAVVIKVTGTSRRTPAAW